MFRNDYRTDPTEQDALIIPSRNGYIVLPARNLRGERPADVLRSTDKQRSMPATGNINWSIYRIRYWFQLILMILGMIGLLAFIGYSVAGWIGLLLISVAGGIGLLATAGFRLEQMLRFRKVRPLNPTDSFALFNMVSKLADKAGLETSPRLYLEAGNEINAYTVADREKAAIVLSSGLLRHLNHRELFGVLAHEVAHLKNGDIRLMMVSDQIRRLTGSMALAGQLLLLLYLPLVFIGQVVIPWSLVLVLILAPFLSLLFQVAISRNRELSADLEAVALSGDPVGLAAALRKITVQTGFWKRLYAPYLRELPEILRTHPDTQLRIKRLEQLQSDR